MTHREQELVIVTRRRFVVGAGVTLAGAELGAARSAAGSMGDYRSTPRIMGRTIMGDNPLPERAQLPRT